MKMYFDTAANKETFAFDFLIFFSLWFFFRAIIIILGPSYFSAHLPYNIVITVEFNHQVQDGLGVVPLRLGH